MRNEHATSDRSSVHSSGTEVNPHLEDSTDRSSSTSHDELSVTCQSGEEPLDVHAILKV